MFGSGDDASWDAVTAFGQRMFHGVSGRACARVNGSLLLVDVHVERFTATTPAEVRDAINSAFHLARAELAHHLATTDDLDLPEPLREVLASNASPEAYSQDEPPAAFEARRCGVVVNVDGDTWLLTKLAVPELESLRLVPDVVNEALAAAESARELPPVDALFDSRWASIVGGLQDVEDRLGKILAEHDQGSAPA